MSIVIAFIIGVVVGGVAGIFIYRNNVKKISQVADKVDGVGRVIKK